jgi:hypothetical protein
MTTLLPGLYSGGDQFRFRSEKWILRLGWFAVLPRPSERISRGSHQMDHVHSIPRPFSHFLNVITGKTALMKPAFLRRFCQNLLLDRQASKLLTSVDITAIFSFLRSKVQPCEQPPTSKTRSLYLCSPSDMVAPLYPQIRASPSVASYASQGYGRGVLTLLHTGALHQSSSSINRL